MRMSGKKGFSLFELMVVIAVIAMVVSFVIALSNDSKAKKRDAKREQDIKQLQSSLSRYKADNQAYPVCPRAVINGLTDCLSQKLIFATFMAGVSADPLGGGNGSCGTAGSFVYCYTSSDGVSYTIEYELETDTVPGKSSGLQSVKPQP